MAQINWTSSQQKAISSRGNVLVAASAGTGKTAVLSARVMEILKDHVNGADIDQMLILTFTDAAAEEMKQRISQNISKAYKETKDPNLKKQLMLLENSQISTIHSFCKKIVTDNFFKLGIDPNFSLIDTDEQMFIKQEILEKVIEEAWEDPILSKGLSELFYKRRVFDITSGFIESIIGAASFMDSLPNRNDWLNRAEYSELGLDGGVNLAEYQRQLIVDKIDESIQIVREVSLRDKNLTGGFWAKDIESFQQALESILNSVLEDDIVSLADVFKGFSEYTLRFKRRGKEISEDTKKMVVDAAKYAYNKVLDCSNFAILNPEYETLISGIADSHCRVFVELVRRFVNKYAEKKQELNCMDFADLEHFALQVLSDKGDIETDVSVIFREKFKYVFVDEYQDVNSVQEAIIQNVSQEDNTFFVGDIKQSIYAFRQAKPEIFSQKLKDAININGLNSLRVDMRDNFRSRAGILGFVNMAFERLMSEMVGAVDYDSQAKFIPGTSLEELEVVSPDWAGPCVEISFLEEVGNKDSDMSNTSLKTSQLQAVFIAQKIKDIVEGTKDNKPLVVFDSDSGEYRNAKYSDIVILMRSLSTKLNEYVEVFRLAGIPVTSGGVTGYFATSEISDFICLLKVLDNQKRDIELASVLRSPLFNFNETELAEVRVFADTLKNRPANFFDAIDCYLSLGNDPILKSKISNALSTLEKWRVIERERGLSDMIWSIFRESGYLSFVMGLPNGKQRRANLLKMHERSIQFEGFISSGLGVSLPRFVVFIERLLAGGNDWAKAEPDTSTENSISIMSIHKSKGLEFPIVILADMQKKFNFSQERDEVIFDDEFTIGFKVIKPKTLDKYPTLRQQVILDRQKKSQISEEMRILYVAMTRAKERLIMVGSTSLKSIQSELCSFSKEQSNIVPSWKVSSKRNFLAWILLGLKDQSEIHQLFDTGFCHMANDSGLFQADWISKTKLLEDAIALEDYKSLSKNDSFPEKFESDELTLKISERLSWQYPFNSRTLLNAKMTVSELTHDGDEFLQKNTDNWAKLKPASVLEANGKVKVPGNVLGTAVHLVLQNIDTSKPINIDTVTAVIQKLHLEEKIDQHTASEIDVASICQFFTSDLGKEALAAGYDNLQREWPFTYGLSANEYESKEGSDSDMIVVQGIIDMVINDGNKAKVVDFKTDKVTHQTAEAGAQKYKKQIEYYAKAIKAIEHREVTQGWIYFLRASVAIRVL